MIGQMTEPSVCRKIFESLVYLSMILQAEGIRHGVEHWRRNRERVSGTLIWQLNDCWPVAYGEHRLFGRWKAPPLCRPQVLRAVLLSIEDKGEVMNVFVTNDTVRAWGGEVRWSLQTSQAKCSNSGRKNFSVKALAAAQVLQPRIFTTRSPTRNRRQVVFVAELSKGTRLISRQVATFAPNKHLELVDRIETIVSISHGKLTSRVENQIHGSFRRAAA